MRATLYIPYAGGDAENGFRYEGDITANQYMTIMNKDYNYHKQGVDYMMVNNKYNNLSINNFEKEKNKYEHLEYDYNDCQCEILDMHRNQETIDNLIKYYQTGEQFIIILNLFLPSIIQGAREKTEDFSKRYNKRADIETELRSWISQSDKIQSCAQLDAHAKMYNLPKKDLRVHFEQEGSNAILDECKLMEIYSRTSFAVLVKKIIFINAR